MGAKGLDASDLPSCCCTPTKPVEGYRRPFAGNSPVTTQISMRLQGLDQLLVIHFNLILLKPDVKHPHTLPLYMNLRRLNYLV